MTARSKEELDKAWSRALELHQAGRPADAELLYRRMLDDEPRLPPVWFHLAMSQWQQGRAGDAIKALDQALALKPDLVEALQAKSEILMRENAAAQALPVLDQWVAVASGNANAWILRSGALMWLRRHDEALENLDRVLALQPGNIDALTNRGTVLRMLKRHAESLENLDKALAARPGDPAILNMRAVTLAEMGRKDEALENSDAAVAAEPGFVSAQYNRAGLLVELQRFADAIQAYDRVIALQPGHADAWWNKALVELRSGDFAQGWKDYEWRKRKQQPFGLRNYAQPLLTSLDNIGGKRVLVYAEQGLGDTIQFSRYINLLAAAGAKVLFAPQARLKFLLGSLTGPFELADADDASLAFDFHTPLMSLPLLFETRLESVPAQMPYLSADPDRTKKWKTKLGKGGFKIGVHATANPTSQDYHLRSFPMALFETLAASADVGLISIQQGGGEKAPKSIKTLGDDFDTGPEAFADTAAVMKNLDLVITSDASVAHLAGALGVPVWVALKYLPDWRWMAERPDSPWYPGMRLFRQKTEGDWDGVFAQIKSALAEAVPKS